MDVWPEALVTVTVAVVPGVTVHWVLLVPEPVGTVKVTDVFDHELTWNVAASPGAPQLVPLSENFT